MCAPSFAASVGASRRRSTRAPGRTRVRLLLAWRFGEWPSRERYAEPVGGEQWRRHTSLTQQPG